MTAVSTKPEIKDIYDTMSSKPSLDEKKLIQKAYDFSWNAHRGQKRKSGEPYFYHVFTAARNVADFGMDATTIAAAMLHDTIEDTPVTEDDIRKEFGEEILFLVNGVTKLGTVKYRGAERHVESLRKFFIASAADLRVVIIKLADRLHNVETLNHVPAEKAKRIALETIEIHAPLAFRLGMGKLTGDLQDAAFPYAYPQDYEIVNDLLKKKKKTDEKYIEKVWKSLKKEMAKNGIKDIKTDARVKRKYSLWRKLLRKDMDIEKVYDIVALRVIVPSIEDCYRLLGIVHSTWRPLPGRIKDYIALPKINGYQSIHTTIFTGDGGIAEIQIRTQEMHNHAEYGIASHFAYKEAQTSESHNGDQQRWIEQLKELQTGETDQQTFLENLTQDFFTDRIFVFTPQGDVIDLPRGASALDLAYAVHSEIGNTSKGAKINGKYSALKTVLENGDIVEIETDKKIQPSSKWLSHVTTTLAKKHIRGQVKDSGSYIQRFFKQ